MSFGAISRAVIFGAPRGLVNLGVRPVRSVGNGSIMRIGSLQGFGRRFATEAKGPRPKEYGGFRPPHVDPFMTRMAEVFLTVMWLWVFYRAKNDLVYMLGFKHPWDDHDHH